MSNDGDVPSEGGDPTEEVGPQGCDARAADTEFRPGELEGPPEESQIQPVEELFDAFVMEPAVMIPSPEDGLPTPAGETHEMATAPPFTYETTVCIGDDREYVELWADETRMRGMVSVRITAERTVSLPAPMTRDGRPVATTLRVRSRYSVGGEEHRRRSFRPEQVVHRWGFSYVQATIDANGIAVPFCAGGGIEEIDFSPQRAQQTSHWQDYGDTVAPGAIVLLPVRAYREPCQHFRQQAFGNDDQPDKKAFGHIVMFSNCLARRSVGGALMSLRDQAVYACEYREPADPDTAKQYIHDFNKKRLTSKAHEVMVPAFGLK